MLYFSNFLSFLFIPPSIFLSYALIVYHSSHFLHLITFPSPTPNPHLPVFISFLPPPLSLCPSSLLHPSCPGSSVSGHDESPGDHAATDAADPPAAGAFPPAAPGPAPAAAGCNAAAGKAHTHTHIYLNTYTPRQTFWHKHSGAVTDI